MKDRVKSIIVENDTEILRNSTLLKRYYLFKDLKSFRHLSSRMKLLILLLIVSCYTLRCNVLFVKTLLIDSKICLTLKFVSFCLTLQENWEWS